MKQVMANALRSVERRCNWRCATKPNGIPAVSRCLDLRWFPVEEVYGESKLRTCRCLQDGNSGETVPIRCGAAVAVDADMA
jgi:hypothetical protein